MRAAWRLAISNVSARPSRSALLIGAVTLSAALIAAVACAIASANGAIERQLEGQLGQAELRVSAVGAGNNFDPALLELIEAWPEVERALPRSRHPISVRLTKQILVPGDDGGWARQNVSYTTSGYGDGVDIAHEFEAKPLTLIAGRYPEQMGEVVIDAQMAEQLAYTFVAGGMSGQDVGHFGTETAYLATPRPEVPERVDSEARAEAINALVGVRPEDTLEVARQFRMPVSFERIGISEEVAMRAATMFFGDAKLTVVGVAEPPPLGGLPTAFMSVETIAAIAGDGGRLDQIEIELAAGADPEAVAERRGAELPEGVLIQATEKVTSGLDKNLASNQLGFILASVMSMLSAAFIIMTGLTTGIAEQERALAIIRCIGGTRAQLGQSQLLIGLIVGSAGAAIGIPLGVGMAWGVVQVYSEFLPTGLRVPGWMLWLAAAGSIGSGLIGAAYPAWLVARTSPLSALANRAKPAAQAQLGLVITAALLGIAAQAAIVGLSPDKDTLFWGYATIGLPAMFVGYFLLSVPVILLINRLVAEPLSRLLRLPPRVLGRTISATPYRHGFTAGAMMGGLALMIAIWSNGGAVLRDWLDRIEFPDAFVNGLRLPVEAQQKLEALPWVADTCAITMHPVEVDAFGVSALQQYRTSFIAFQPDEFFDMTSVQFLDGDQQTALARLNEGGAIIVGREFNVAQGLGVGDVFTCRSAGAEHSFEIVGVVTSPGLELASKFFNIGEEYIDQSIHAVFGSRGDMKTLFGSDNTQLIQIAFDWDALEAAAAADGAVTPDAADRWAIQRVRGELFGLGILDAGSGRKIKREITTYIGGALVVFSAVAVVSMLVACFGVANLIVAGIESRQFEFGVLRAVGAQRGLLVRLVLAEAVVIGLAAAVVGTLMGIQGSWAGQRIYGLLLGLAMELRVPLKATAFGWGIVMLFTIGAAVPAIARLNRRKTRELLSAVRG